MICGGISISESLSSKWVIKKYHPPGNYHNNMTFGILLHRSWKAKWLKIFFVISLLPEGTTTIACPYECLFTTQNSEAFFRSTYVRKLLHRSFEINYY